MSSYSPKVSVIIPNYNTAHYLSEAIESVLASRFLPEIIIIDDGSSDNTIEVVTPYLALPNFKFIQQENKGLSGARNTGIKASSGEYLVFLDSDDIILPDKLERQVNFLNENMDCDAVYSSSIFFRDDSRQVKIPTLFPNYSGHILQHLLYGNFIHVNAIMVRKEAVVKAGLFDESLRELEDWDLWLRLSMAGSKFYYQDQVLSEVRLRKGSMTSNQDKMNQTMLKVLKKHFNNIVSSFNNNRTILSSAHESLLLYKLLAKEKENFNTHVFCSLKQLGLPFLPTVTKLFIKRYISSYIKFENKTTKNLEKVWDE